jgi:hypothetical protein
MGGKTLPVGRQELPKAARQHGGTPAPLGENLDFPIVYKTAPLGTLLAMS